MEDAVRKIAMVTGASAGIGAATARAFAREGWALALGARRCERLDALRAEISGEVPCFVRELDVRHRESVRAFVAEATAELGAPGCLVNNAGLARGVERLDDAEGEAWREMIDTNLVGVLQMTREVLPILEAAGGGHVIMIGSVAGDHAYAGGSVYCATKRAIWSLCEALRRETLGRGIRVSSIEPGLAETEFSAVRFPGDAERARRVYDGIDALSAEDVAECVLFAATRPLHVNLDRMRVMPTAQADPWNIWREAPGGER